MFLTRYCLATRLNRLDRSLNRPFAPWTTSLATLAGCACEDFATNLTAATQGRTILAMRHGGVLPGAATTASAQHISCVAAAERFISKIGAVLEWRGTEPSALRRLRERIQAREANITLETLTPLEACFVNKIELINTAHADPEVRGLRISSTRGAGRREPTRLIGRKLKEDARL